MRDFWDLNNDGKLDIGEQSMRDTHILNVLDDMEAEQNKSNGYGGYSNASGNGVSVLRVIFGIIGAIILFVACAA